MGSTEVQDGWINFYCIDRPAVAANCRRYVVSGACSNNQEAGICDRKAKRKIVRTLISGLLQKARMSAEKFWRKIDDHLIADMVHVDEGVPPFPILKIVTLDVDLLIRGPDGEVVQSSLFVEEQDGWHDQGDHRKPPPPVCL